MRPSQRACLRVRLPGWWPNHLLRIPLHPTCRSFGVVVWEIITGERPQRGQLRMPRVPEECPQVGHVGLGRAAAGLGAARAACRSLIAAPLVECTLAPAATPSVSSAHPQAPLQDVCDLMVQCLSEDPAQRPTAQQLMRRLGEEQRAQAQAPSPPPGRAQAAAAAPRPPRGAPGGRSASVSLPKPTLASPFACGPGPGANVSSNAPSFSSNEA